MLVTIIAVTAAFATSMAPASAQAASCPPGGGGYPPSACAAAVSSSQVRPGEAIQVSGSGFAPGSTVSIQLGTARTALGTARVNAGGSFSTTVVVPADTPPGRQTLFSVGTGPQSRQRELTATVQVLGVQQTRDDAGGGGAGGGGAGGSDLPRTGAGLAVPTGIAGIVLTGIGSLLVVSVRRRRTTG